MSSIAWPDAVILSETGASSVVGDDGLMPGVPDWGKQQIGARLDRAGTGHLDEFGGMNHGKGKQSPNGGCLSSRNASSSRGQERFGLEASSMSARHGWHVGFLLARQARRLNNLPARSCPRTTRRRSDMRYPTMILLSSCLLAASSASADQPLDSARSLWPPRLRASAAKIPSSRSPASAPAR